MGNRIVLPTRERANTEVRSEQGESSDYVFVSEKKS